MEIMDILNALDCEKEYKEYTRVLNRTIIESLSAVGNILMELNHQTSSSAFFLKPFFYHIFCQLFSPDIPSRNSAL